MQVSGLYLFCCLLGVESGGNCWGAAGGAEGGRGSLDLDPPPLNPAHPTPLLHHLFIMGEVEPFRALVRTVL